MAASSHEGASFMTEDVVILTSLEQYRFELFQEARLTHQEDQEVIARAREQDPGAREELIRSCLRYVAHVAWHYHPAARESDDYLDIVGVGNLAIVEHIDRALTMVNPKAFLLETAKWTMFRYCIYYSSLVPRKYRNREPIACISIDCPSLNGMSLHETLAVDEPLTVQEAEPSYDDLYRAIYQLDEKHRMVILRHYGLDGDEPESLYVMSKRLSPNPKQSIAHLRHRRALIKLYHILTMMAEVSA